jgi:hypothetical protein
MRDGTRNPPRRPEAAALSGALAHEHTRPADRAARGMERIAHFFSFLVSGFARGPGLPTPKKKKTSSAERSGIFPGRVFFPARKMQSGANTFSELLNWVVPAAWCWCFRRPEGDSVVRPEGGCCIAPVGSIRANWLDRSWPPRSSQLARSRLLVLVWPWVRPAKRDAARRGDAMHLGGGGMRTEVCRRFFAPHPPRCHSFVPADQERGGRGAAQACPRWAARRLVWAWCWCCFSLAFPVSFPGWEAGLRRDTRWKHDGSEWPRSHRVLLLAPMLLVLLFSGWPPFSGCCSVFATLTVAAEPLPWVLVWCALADQVLVLPERGDVSSFLGEKPEGVLVSLKMCFLQAAVF